MVRRKQMRWTWAQGRDLLLLQLPAQRVRAFTYTSFDGSAHLQRLLQQKNTPHIAVVCQCPRSACV